MEDHDQDLGAVGAAAAAEGDDGAANDGSGTYQVYIPKLVKVSPLVLLSSCVRRCARAAAHRPDRSRCFRGGGKGPSRFVDNTPLPLPRQEGKPHPDPVVETLTLAAVRSALLDAGVPAATSTRRR